MSEFTKINPHQVSEARLINVGRPVVQIYVAGSHRFTIKLFADDEAVDENQLRPRYWDITRLITSKSKDHEWLTFNLGESDSSTVWKNLNRF